MWPEGAPAGRADGWRGGSADSQVALGGRRGRGAAAAGAERRRRSTAGELRMAAATDPLDEHTLAAVAAGVSTRRYASTLDPVPGRRDRAGDLEQCRVAAVRGAVGRSASGVSRAAVGGAGPAGGLHRRQGVPGTTAMVVALGIDAEGRKHVLGLREGATETAAVTTGLLSDLVTRGLPTDRTLRSSSTALRDFAGPSRRCSVLAAWCNAVRCTSAETCSAIYRSGCTPPSGQGRCGMRGTSTRRTARRGCWSGWRGRWSATTPARRRPSREGLVETLTVQRLGLTGALHARCARRTSSRT